jgi:hypothetical protein
MSRPLGLMAHLGIGLGRVSAVILVPAFEESKYIEKRRSHVQKENLASRVSIVA